MSGSAVSLYLGIKERLDSRWDLVRSDVPVEMPNSPTVADRSGDAYARLSLLSDGEPYTEAAGDTYPERHFDTVQLEVLARIGTGRLARDIADDWATLWRDHPIPGFRFGVTRILEVGRVGEGEQARWKVDALTRVERSFEP